MQWAECLIAERFAKHARTNLADASWRGQPASEKQAALLREQLAALAALGGPDVEVLAGLQLSRGDTSGWIDILMLARAFYSGRFSFPRFYV